MAVWSVVSRSSVTDNQLRIDGEYYRPENLEAYAKVSAAGSIPLSRVAEAGYRVVYENTKILPPDKVNKSSVRFLQAANIDQSGLDVDISSIGFVGESDWQRYPMGRIHSGELLIEVKGKAEKAYIVQNDFPVRTLVSGSLFKLNVNRSVVTPEYLLAYFSSRHGRLLRDRVKANTLIGFVSKPQLYAIPVFQPCDESISEISTWVTEAYRNRASAKNSLDQAQTLIESELGLDKLTFENSSSYASRFSKVSLSRSIAANRVDAQCFSPSALQYEKVLSGFPNTQALRFLTGAMIKGTQQEETPKGDIPYVSIKHIQNAEIVAEGNSQSFDGMPIAKRDDLLLAITGATIGKIGIVSRYDELTFSGDMLAIRTNDAINPYFLFAFLSHRIGQIQLQRWITGSTNGHLAPRDVGRVLIPRLDNAVEAKIAALTSESISSIHESEKLLERAKCRVEKLIEEAIAA